MLEASWNADFGAELAEKKVSGAVKFNPKALGRSRAPQLRCSLRRTEGTAGMQREVSGINFLCKPVSRPLPRIDSAADAIIERVEIFNAQNTAKIKLKPLGIYRSTHADSARTKRGRAFIDKEAKNIAELTEDVIFRLMIKYKCDVHTGKYGKPDISLEADVYERAMNSKAPVMAAYTSP